MLRRIQDAGYTVEVDLGDVGRVVMTAYDADCNEFRAEGGDEVEAVVKLAEALGFEDLD